MSPYATNDTVIRIPRSSGTSRLLHQLPVVRIAKPWVLLPVSALNGGASSMSKSAQTLILPTHKNGGSQLSRTRLARTEDDVFVYGGAQCCSYRRTPHCPALLFGEEELTAREAETRHGLF